MAKYSSAELQQIIDDLDYAQAFFPVREGLKEMQQVRRSLKHASDIIADLPDELEIENNVGCVFVA